METVHWRDGRKCTRMALESRPHDGTSQSPGSPTGWRKHGFQVTFTAYLNVSSRTFESCGRPFDIDRIPIHDRADDEIETGGAERLTFGRQVAEFTSLVEKYRPLEFVRCLALVEARRVIGAPVWFVNAGQVSPFSIVWNFQSLSLRSRGAKRLRGRIFCPEERHHAGTGS
jgi:hypothetical protein